MSAGDYGDDILTPLQTRQLLGVSRTRILQFEDRGELHAIRDERGVHRYMRSEVERLVRVRASSPDRRVARVGAKLPGDVVARVFELFDDGWTLPQIVRETKLPPEAVRALHVEYRTPVDQPSPKLAKGPSERALPGKTANGAAAPLARILNEYDARLRKDEGT
jgi:hypothetical protein